MDVIEPAHEEWATPILFDLEKDNSLQYCANYYNPNSVTVLELYSVLDVDKFIANLCGKTIFRRSTQAGDSGRLE